MKNFQNTYFSASLLIHFNPRDALFLVSLYCFSFFIFNVVHVFVLLVCSWCFYDDDDDDDGDDGDDLHVVTRSEAAVVREELRNTQVLPRHRPPCACVCGRRR